MVDLISNEDLVETKENMDTIDEFIYSEGDTLVDQYGNTRKTLEGVINSGGTGTGALTIESAKHLLGAGGVKHFHINEIDVSGDYTFELDVLIPSGGTYRNVFSLGASTDYKYGQVYMYKTNTTGGYEILINANGVDTSESTPFIIGAATVVDERATVTVVKSGSDFTLWINGTFADKVAATGLGKVPNAGLSMFGYGDGTVISGDGTGIVVYGWRFAPYVMYTDSDGVSSSLDIGLVPIVPKPTTPIEVVAEFPVTPEPSTLYIKAV